MLHWLIGEELDVDLGTSFGRALMEERYWSLRRQIPVIYLLGLVNTSGLELATGGTLFVGANLPTLIALCGVIRILQWFYRGKEVSHARMAKRVRQTVWFASIVCVAVCARCLYLLDIGDAASRMAVMLFGGLTAIGVAYGLTALPTAARIPLFLIIAPITVAALLTRDPQFMWAAFGLVVVATLTMRLLAALNRHFTDVIKSRSVIAHQQELTQRAHQEAAIAAMTDFLTGLPNRRAFLAALETEICKVPERSTFAVGILDLDRFKAVNDTFGHAAGDKALQEVAARIVQAAGARGLVARLGGDEFGILLPGIRRPSDARLFGARMIAQLNSPVVVGGRQFNLSASCGFGISQRGANSSPSRVMADADLALYQAKESPAQGVAVFELRMAASRRRKAQIERALQSPGIADNLRLVFQPIVRLNDGQIMAHEALARWTDPALGEVSPAEFVPIAEQLNRIESINSHLMRMAFDEARNWPPQIRLSFNLSAVQLCSPGSARMILNALEGAKVPTGRLQVEVTETALLADFDQARANLTELREAGVTIVLDDFGAGYASIGYLRQLQFDQIKLDGALVAAAQDSIDGKRLLRAVIMLCDILNVSSVAEHVESEESLKLLIDLGCTAGQGFWLMRPSKARKIQGLLHVSPNSVRSANRLPTQRAA